MANERVQLHVEDSGGSGRPVVLVHGWPMSAASWEAQLDPLTAAGYRVISYDRRGFGRSAKPEGGYDYDTLADDLASVLEERDLHRATLVGFSMGGGEVARYITRHGDRRLHSVVFAAAVTPFLLRTADNPEGPLAVDAARTMRNALLADREAFFEQFTHDFFSVAGVSRVSEAERLQALAMCQQSDPTAALACMDAWAHTDFRADLARIHLPTLVIHGAGDAIVPFEGSGRRTRLAIRGSELVVIDDAPHGLMTSHAGEFNAALLGFLLN